MPEEPYTLADIAKLLDVNPATVRYWVSEGRLKAYKDPNDQRRWLVDRADIDELIASRPSWTRQRKAKAERATAVDPPPKRGPQRPGRSISDLMGGD